MCLRVLIPTLQVQTHTAVIPHKRIPMHSRQSLGCISHQRATSHMSLSTFRAALKILFNLYLVVVTLHNCSWTFCPLCSFLRVGSCQVGESCRRTHIRVPWGWRSAATNGVLHTSRNMLAYTFLPSSHSLHVCRIQLTEDANKPPALNDAG